jgi:pimeloyl-ACP methyl ester carboxylesterase
MSLSLEKNQSFRHRCGTAICTTIDGPGPLVVMVHGWSCRAEYWQAQVDALRGRQALMLIDLPGHGEAPAPTSDLDIEVLADVVRSICEANEHQRFVLVGHSMGGAVVLEAARKLRQAVAGVLLADTFLINYGELDEATIGAYYDPFAQDFRAAVDNLVDNCAGEKTTAETRARLKAGMGAGDPAVMLPLWDSLLRWQPQDALRQCPAPIHAINCPLIPETTRQRLSPYMTDTVLPGTGHFLALDDAEAFNNAMMAWLQKLD